MLAGGGYPFGRRIDRKTTKQIDSKTEHAAALAKVRNKKKERPSEQEGPYRQSTLERAC